MGRGHMTIRHCVHHLHPDRSANGEPNPWRCYVERESHLPALNLELCCLIRGDLADIFGFDRTEYL